MGDRQLQKFLTLVLFLGLVPLGSAASQVDVLLVADGHRLADDASVTYQDDMFVDDYRSSLKTVQDVSVDVYETNLTDGEMTGPSYEEMSEYDAVVWYTLADYDTETQARTLRTEDIGNLTKYLNQGGRLYLNGHLLHIDMLQEPFNSFYNKELGTKFQEDTGLGPNYFRFAGSGIQEGLRYELYDNSGYGANVNNLNQMNDKFNEDKDGVSKIGEGVYDRLLAWGSEGIYRYGTPTHITEKQSDDFAWKVSGLINITSSGTYSFGLDSDDASDLFIDGERVVKWYGRHGLAGEPGETGSIYLSEGLHNITVRMQEKSGDQGLALYWKPPGWDDYWGVSDELYSIKPSWKYSEVRAQGQSEGEMTFDSVGNLRLSGKLGGENFDLGLNVSTEPPDALGVITDKCQLEEVRYKQVDRKSCGYAEDPIDWQNNITEQGSTIHKEKGLVRDLYVDEDKSFQLEASGGDDTVLLTAFAIESTVLDKEIPKVTYNGREMTELHSIEGSDGSRRLQVFYLKSPEDGSHSLEVHKPTTSSSTAMQTYLYDDVSPENPIGDNATNNGENSIRTQVRTSRGDKVIDFLESNGGSTKPNSTEQRKVFEIKEEFHDFYLYGSEKISSGNVEMAWDGDSHTAHSVINLRGIDQKYYMEVDDDRPQAFNYPDTLASGLVRNSPEDYRSIYTSFGLESVRSSEDRNRLAKSILNYIIGPRTKDTKVYSGEDLPTTGVDESKYTNSTLNLTSTGFHSIDNSELADARFFQSNSSKGLSPAFEDGFENISDTNSSWDRSADEDSLVTDKCGVKKGENAMVLASNNDTSDELRLESKEMDLSSSEEITLELWVKIGGERGGTICDAPEADDSDSAGDGEEDLYIQYMNESGGSWKKLSKFDVKGYDGDDIRDNPWRKKEIRINQSIASDSFRFRFRKIGTDYPDSWIVDEVELDSSLNVSSGSFFSGRNVTVEGNNIDATSVSADLSSYEKGINVTYGIQFKDNSTQGYWGVKGTDWIVVDTVPPEASQMDLSQDYVNDESVSITLDRGSTAKSFNPDLVRFSCDKTSWSRWRDRNDEKTQTYTVDITGSGLGCPSRAGNRTVYADFRDYAGNKADKIRKDWVVYDTEKPKFQGIGPLNNSAIQLSEEFILNASDNYTILSGTKTVGSSTFENVYNEGDENKSLSVNSTGGLDPFSSRDSGNSTFVSYIFDRALNLRKNYFKYDVDQNPPSIGAIEASGDSVGNNSAILPGSKLRFDIEDRNFDAAILNNGTDNKSFSSSSFEYDPAWSEGYRQVELWLNDTAGNLNESYYNFTVDGTDPLWNSISEKNSSYILNTTSIAFNFSDSLSGVRDIDIDEEVVEETEAETSDVSLTLLNDTEGVYQYDITVRDRAGNQKVFTFEHTIDTEPPFVFSDYSNSGTWISYNTSVSVNATDDKNLSTISYCVADVSCPLDSYSDPGQNVTVPVGCSEGKTCNKTVFYKANDSAGNLNGTFRSDYVLIDKQEPEASINGPGSKTVVGGLVDIETQIEDLEAGIHDANYTIYNESNASQIFEQGDLNFSNSYDAEWDSKDDIPGIEDVFLNVTATDNVGNTLELKRDFRVDNSQTSVTIRRPYRSYVNETFELKVDARRPGNNVLETHNYSIYNSSDIFVKGDEDTGIDSSEHSFSTSLDSSDLGADGNYTLESYAFDNGTGSANTSSWFFLDTKSPSTSLDRPSQWVTGVIDLSYQGSDETKNGSIYWRYKDDGGSFGEKNYIDFGGGSFQFDTANCDDDNQSDCVLRLKATDKAGNSNSSRIELKVDNSKPTTSIQAPEPGSWQNEDFVVERTDSDEQVDESLLECSRNIEGSGFTTTGCDDFSVELDSSGCGDQGRNSCQVEIRVENPAGLVDTDSRSFSIDYEAPEVLGLSPEKDSFVNDSVSFEVNFTDSTSGMSYSYWNASGVKNNLTNSTEFSPGWTDSGNKTLRIILNDTAGNLVSKNYDYTFDNQKPNLTGSELSKEKGLNDEVRIYRGEELEFRANISDDIRVNRTLVEIQGDSKGNLSLSRESGNYTNGTWSLKVGSRKSTGLYNITKIYIYDRAGNLKTVNSGLPEFRVVDYSIEAREQEVDAGYRDEINLTVNFNKSAGTRIMNLSGIYSGQDRFSLNNVTCSFSGYCNISNMTEYLKINASGGEILNLLVDPGTLAPAVDRNLTYMTEILDVKEEDRTLYKAPNLSVQNLECVNSCTVDQFENFTVSLDVVNNRTAETSGKAIDVYTELENIVEGRSFLKNISNVSEGTNNSVTFSNLSISKHGTHDISVVTEDRWTETYGDSGTLEITVRDIEKPVLERSSISAEKVSVNETVEFEAKIKDNDKVASANVTLVNSSGQKENITLERSSATGEQFIWRDTYSKTSERGTYNFTDIYVADVNGNYRNKTLGKTFEVSTLEMNVSLLDNVTEVGNNVRFSVNVTDNPIPVSSIEINVTEPLGDEEQYTYTDVDTENIINFNDIPNSGNYSFNVTVNAGSSVTNSTQNLSVRFGNSSLENLNGNSSKILLPRGARPYNLTYFLEPLNGGLRGVNLDMDSSNRSVIEPINENKSEGDVYSDNGIKEIGYEVGPSPKLGEANLTLNLTADRGNGTDERITVKVNETDNISPKILNVTTSETQLYLSEELKFDINLTDNSLIKNLTVKIEHPDNKSGITEVLTPEYSESGLYETTFGNTTEKGLYNYTVVVYDVAGNRDNFSGTFNVTDSLNVDLVSDQRTYVKGERILYDADVSDPSGERLRDFNITAKISLNGTQNITIADGNGITEFAYGIGSNDPPSKSANPTTLPKDYKAYVTVEKGPVTEEVVKTVDVTRILYVSDFRQPSYIEPGSKFRIAAEWSEPYGEKIGAISFTAYAVCDRCPEGTKQFVKMEENSSTGYHTASFTAPNVSDEIQVRLLGSDSSGNSESQINSDPADPAPSRLVTVGGQGTEANNTGGGGLPSGGFGGSGGPSMQIERVSPGVQISPDAESVELAVNTNIAAQCVYSTNSIPDSVSFKEASKFTETGGVNHTTTLQLGDRSTYSYSVMCASENVNSTTDIIFSTDALETFTFAAPTSLTPGNESVTQFKNSSGRLIVYNDQNTPIDVEFSIEADCCNLSVVRGSDEVDSVTIPSGGESSLKVEAYAPLFVEPGTYDGTLMLSTVNDSSSHPFSFQVSPHPAVQNYTDLKRRAELLNSSIGRYRIAGIDTSRMRKAFGNLTDHLKEGNRSIQDNDLEGLKSAVREGREDAEAIDTMLKDAALKKYVLLNWWKWAAAFVVLYILFFLVVMVGIPYYRIQTELTRIDSQLESAIEARKKGEKQYFQRKIDKDTFNEMMTERQNEVLELRGQKEDLKEELDGFLWKKLTLENYLKAPWKGMQELEKWWAANRRARENLKDGDEEEGEE